MKKIISFILILLFVNSSLLLPQVNESFADNNAVSDDHMGSLVEWINEILMEQKDDTPDEKDDKTLENSIEETLCHRSAQRSDLTPHTTNGNNKLKFADFAKDKLPSRAFDVIAPPPEHCFS